MGPHVCRQCHGEVWSDVRHLVTNGPFILKEWQPGEKISLVRNLEYFGRFPGNLTQVEVYLDEEIQAWDQIAAFKDNQVDYLDLSPENFSARHQFTDMYQQVELSSTLYLGFGPVESPFQDRRVRQAFGMTIDRGYLANVIYQGFNVPANGGFLPPGFPGHSPDIGLPYDPDLARTLLAGAGFPDGRGFPEIELQTQPGFLAIYPRYLQETWGTQLGIRVNIKTLAWQDFVRHADESPLYLLGWSADYPDPDSFMRVHIPWNAGHWLDERYDQLIEKATRISDQGERLRLYRQADRILMEEVALVPTVYGAQHYLIRPDVKVASPYLLRLEEVVIEPH